MKNLIRLTKINLLTIFDFYKIKNANTSSEKRKALSYFCLIIFAFLYLSGYILFYANVAFKGLKTMNLTSIMLPVGMSLVSTYILFMTIFTINKTIFNAKDYSILQSLPIKKSTIISSKILFLYLVNMIYDLAFMLPIYIAYLKTPNLGFLFHLSFWLTFLIIPMVPTVIGAILGTIVTFLSSKFKHKNLANIISSIFLIVILMYVSFKSGNLNSIDIANMNKSIINFFNKYYPLTNLYYESLNGKMLSLLLFIAISVGIYELYKYFSVIYFDKLNSDLKAVTIIKKYNSKNNKVMSEFSTLLKKEFKKYFSSSIYLLNTGIGPILLTISVIILVISGPKKLEVLLQMKNLNDAISSYLPIIFSLFSSLSCTTYPSVSLEGNCLWLLKSSPIKTNNILLAKLSLNYITTLPFIIIDAIIISIYLHLSAFSFFVLIFTPSMYTIFIAALGLYLNIKMPDFEWTNEVKVIKQSMPAFITIFAGMIMAIVPLSIDTHLSSDLYSLLIGSIMLLLNIGIYALLFTKGKKEFELL